jgi:hypothetical protein
MVDLGENPIATMLYAIWDLIGWALVIIGTWSAGLWIGIWVGTGRIPSLLYLAAGVWMSLLGWLICPVIIIGLGTSMVSWYLPMKIESRKLAIWAASANFTVWMIVGANISWF